MHHCRFFSKVFLLVAGVVLFMAGFSLSWPAYTPAIRRGPAPVSSLEAIELGGARQWILIRGENSRAPLLIFLHGGPGMPAMYLAHTFQLELERDFVVVQWDRRGAGKSYASGLDATLTSEQLVNDTIELIETLNARFHRTRVVLVGHSWGTYLGALVAARRPDLIQAYVGIGQLGAMGAAIRDIQLQFLRAEARRRGDAQGLRALDKNPGNREALLFKYGAEVRKMTSFYPLLWTGLTAPEYSARDIYRLTQGLALYSQSFRYNSIKNDLQQSILRFEVPVYFATGRHDYTDPFVLTESYFAKISAPRKELVWFEDSAHFPFLEEPAAFARLMRRVALETGPRTSLP